MAEDREPESIDESTPATGDQSGSSDAVTDAAETTGAGDGDHDTTDPDPTVPEDRSEPDSIETDGSTDVEPGETGSDAADQTRSDDVDPDDSDGTGDPEPALVGAPAKRSSRARDAAKANGKGEAATTTIARAGSGKGRATPKQRRAPEQPRRTGPVRFASESVGELRKVVYPTGTQLRTYFVVVLVFVLFVIAFVSLLDLGFGWVILRVFG